MLANLHESQPVALDARMLPHEWIFTGERYLKTDAADHWNDHFFPGPQDIAWDLAATAVEFDLEAPAQVHLLSRYEALSGDRDVHYRIPFYTLAYLAFRVGYCCVAAQPLGNSPDALRFQAKRAEYAGILRREIERHG